MKKSLNTQKDKFLATLILTSSKLLFFAFRKKLGRLHFSGLSNLSKLYGYYHTKRTNKTIQMMYILFCNPLCQLHKADT